MEYTVDFFIEKFSKLDNWCMGALEDAAGNRCALGHTMEITGTYPILKYGSTEETAALCDLFLRSNLGYISAVDVNNGNHSDYRQPAPKERVLAALQDIKAKQEGDKAVEEVNNILKQNLIYEETEVTV